MMTRAFELAGSHGHVVPGSRGSFKQASLVVMGVMRESRSTLLAMLEAFLYDPLLSWTVGLKILSGRWQLTTAVQFGPIRSSRWARSVTLEPRPAL